MIKSAEIRSVKPVGWAKRQRAHQHNSKARWARPCLCPAYPLNL